MKNLVWIILGCLLFAGCVSVAPKKHVGQSLFYAWPNSGPPFPGDTNHYGGTNGYWSPPNDAVFDRTKLFLIIGQPWKGTNGSTIFTNINITVTNAIPRHIYAMFWTRVLPIGKEATNAVGSFVGSTNPITFTNAFSMTPTRKNKFYYTIDLTP